MTDVIATARLAHEPHGLLGAAAVSSGVNLRGDRLPLADLRERGSHSDERGLRRV